MHNITSHRIESLSERMFRIIYMVLTIICFTTTLAEANGQPQPPLHYDIIKTKLSPNYNSRIRYIIIQSKDEQQDANNSSTPVNDLPDAHYVVSRTKNNLGQIIIHQMLSEDQSEVVAIENVRFSIKESFIFRNRLKNG